MSDTTIMLLQNSIISSENNEQQLFIADENIDDNHALLKFSGIMPVITNRYHIFSALQQSNGKHKFSDFDFSHIKDESLQRIYYRTSKEKPVVHHIINSAVRKLKTGGELVMAGEKQQGIQTYIKKTEQLFGSTATVKKDGPSRIGVICKNITGELLDDSDYTTLRPAIITEDITFYSKPGVFGWDKIDQGSAFLASHLDLLNIKNNRLLDLGCGYGYLSVMANKHTPALTHATDNNAAALLACRKNFETNNVTGEVIADHIGASLTPGYDVILCNPPFHQGFDVERTLTESFLAASARLLKKRGQALFVVNSFIALEKVAGRYFGEVTAVADNKRFKLVLLTAN